MIFPFFVPFLSQGDVASEPQVVCMPKVVWDHLVSPWNSFSSIRRSLCLLAWILSTSLKSSCANG